MSAVWRDRPVLNSTKQTRSGKASLDAFNRQVLACQDRAFTLALYLLGDETGADAAVAQAVREVYARNPPVPAIPAQILRHLLHQNSRPRGARPGSDRQDRVRALPPRQRAALLLVDVLGLGYNEAAEVLGCSRDRLARWLGAARQRWVEQARE